MSEGCSPNNDVKPGAPVLTKLTIVENGATTTTITGDTLACATGIKPGDECRLVDETPPKPDPDGGANDGGASHVLAKADPTVCRLHDADWCRCQGDPMMSELGAWNCDPFSPLSVVVATFDRLLDTDPLDPGDASSRDDIASLTATPKPPVAVTPAVDYSATGAPSGGVFSFVSPNFFMNFRSEGPSLAIVSTPAQAANATISIVLDSTKVRAKDGKTPFTGAGFLADGALKFKTAAFSASITTPTAPPPMVDPDAGTADMDAGATDAGAVADAGASDAGASDAVASDAPAMPAPAPADPVPADMNKGAVTIDFNNLVDATVLDHIKVTVDGVPFTDFTGPDPMTDFPLAKVTLTPATEWAMGKTYVITVDGNVKDLVGDKLEGPVTATFMMAN